MTKPTNDIFMVVGLLITGAGTFATFGTLPSPLRLGTSNNVLLFSGKILLMSGLGFLLWRVVLLAIIDKFKSPPCKLGRQSAAKADLKEVHALYVTQFGSDAPKLKQMRQWHKRNSRIFQIIVELDPLTRKRKIVASFKAVPLNNEAIARLEMEQMTGSTLTENYIVRPRGRPRAWYIGDLVSTSPTSARAVMRELRDYLISNLGTAVPIFARALTEDGLHYMSRFHFEPVGETPMGIGPICTLRAADLPDVIAELRAAKSPRKRKLPKVANSTSPSASNDSLTG